MSIIDRLLSEFINNEFEFGKTFKSILKNDLKMNVMEFSKKSKISQSTLYKLISEKRQPNIRTVRLITQALKKLEGRTEEGFIGIIAARPVIEKIVERKIILDGEKIVLREYSASNIEEAIIAAVNAERDGASAVVCAPIIGTTIGKIIKIPVVTIMPEQSVIRAIKQAAKIVKIRY